MAEKEYMVFFKDLSKKTITADNILSALQSVGEIDEVIRISLYDKGKFAVSGRVVDEEFETQDEFRPATDV